MGMIVNGRIVKGRRGGDGHQQDFFSSGIQQMGLVNALRTGNPMIDMMVALVLPALLDRLTRWATDVWQYILYLIESRNPLPCERWIEHKTTRDCYGDVYNDEGQDIQNSILIKAIDLYIHSVVKLDLRRADVDLTSTEADLGQDDDDSYCYYRHFDDDDDDNREEKDDGLAAALSKYQVIRKPPIHNWHKLGEYGGGDSNSTEKNSRKTNNKKKKAEVRLRVEREQYQNGSSTTSPSTHVILNYVLNSKSGDAIDDFISKAYQFYINELRKLDNNVRYLYEPKALASAKNAVRVYNRFPLSEEKTFSSLFFRSKDSLLKLLSHFHNRTGKYSIPGYPHKLGLLLNGPPGSGKTSFIKALAQYTGRSIINVNLAQVKTNAELMALFNSHKRHVEGESGVPVKLGFEDVIFVMEDVDAASRVVKRRGKLGEYDNEDNDNDDDVQGEDGTENAFLSKSVWQLFLESNEEACVSLVKTLMEKSPRLKQEAARSGHLTELVNQVRAIPGLGLVKEAAGARSSDDNDDNDNNNNDYDPIGKIGADALCTAKKAMEDSAKVGQYLAAQAKLLATRIQQGAQVNDAFVDALLGKGSFEGVVRAKKTRPRTTRTIIEETPENHHHDAPGGGTLDLSALQEVVALAAMTKAAAAAASSGTTTPPTATPSETTSTASSSPGDHRQQHEQQQQQQQQLVRNINNNKNKKMDNDFEFDLPPALSFWNKPEKDELNLSGLLNVLDGVVDSPGRIIVMTTNHVDHLDPALIRPGRIDKRLFLGYMEAVDVVAMLEHYFQETLTVTQRQRVEAAITGKQQQQQRPLSLTPAQVEQMTAEFDELEDMIVALECKGRRLAVARH